MSNADDQPTTPPVPPVPPVPPTGSSPYSPATPQQPDANATPAAAPSFPTAPPAYQPSAQPNAYAPGQPYAPGAAVPPRGLAIASMITGIAGLVLAFVGVGFLPAVAGVVLGHIAQRKQPYARPFWLTGIITGYVGVAIGLITAAFWIFLFVVGFSSSSSYNDFS